MKKYQTFKSQEELIQFVWQNVKMQSTFSPSGNVSNTSVINSNDILDELYADVESCNIRVVVDTSETLAQKLDLSDIAYQLWVVYKDTLDGQTEADRFLSFIMILFSKVDAKLLVWVAKAGIHACARCGKFISSGDQYQMTYSIMGSNIPGKIFFHQKCALEAIDDIKKQCSEDEVNDQIFQQNASTKHIDENK